MAPSLGGLVDAENGLVSRHIFIEREIYAQELERVFARCWLFLCHESQIPALVTSSPPIWAKPRSWSGVTARENCKLS